MGEKPKLSRDFWRGIYCDSEDVEEPSWAQVAQSILRLDAKQRTTVTLTYTDGSHLCVGGGSGRFLVYIGTVLGRDETFTTLIDPKKPASGEEFLVVGGQEGLFPPRQIVNQEMTLQAAHTFFELGTRDTTLAWIDE